jgi:hypothetical protein
MVMTILVTFLLTSAMYAALVACGAVRVIRHLQTDRAGVQAVIDHVLMPLLGRTPEQVEKKKPAPKDARLS